MDTCGVSRPRAPHRAPWCRWHDTPKPPTALRAAPSCASCTLVRWPGQFLNVNSTRREPRPVVLLAGSLEDRGVVAGRSEPPRTLARARDARRLRAIRGDDRVVGAVAADEIRVHRGPVLGHPCGDLIGDRRRVQPVERVPADVAMANLVAQDP